MPRHLAKHLSVLLALIVSAGCGGHGAPTQPAPDPLAGMPAPASPSGAVRALEWGWANRSTDAYRLLFTSDYVFTFASRDGSGAPWTGNAWTREVEELSFATLVHGGDTNQPAATKIALTLDRNFIVLNDPRPGMDDLRRHKSISTQVYLDVNTADGAETIISGSATFYLVRGDSAAIPPELGLAPDSTRWYVSGWLDNTNGSGAALTRTENPTPTANKTWGSLKALYVQPSRTR